MYYKQISAGDHDEGAPQTVPGTEGKRTVEKHSPKRLPSCFACIKGSQTLWAHIIMMSISFQSSPLSLWPAGFFTLYQYQGGLLQDIQSGFHLLAFNSHSQRELPDVSCFSGEYLYLIRKVCSAFLPWPAVLDLPAYSWTAFLPCGDDYLFGFVRHQLESKWARQEVICLCSDCAW